MRLCRRLILGWWMASGCLLAHAVPTAVSSRDMSADYNLVSQHTAAESQGAYAGRLASAWAQGVALPGPDMHAAASTRVQDDETVYHRVRHSMEAVIEQASGVLSRPAPKLGGLVLVLLTVFALVLGFLSLRWHRETAE